MANTNIVTKFGTLTSIGKIEIHLPVSHEVLIWSTVPPECSQASPTLPSPLDPACKVDFSVEAGKDHCSPVQMQVVDRHSSNIGKQTHNMMIQP